MYQYKDSGLDYVYLSNGYDVINTPHGEGVAIHDMEGLHQVIGLGIVSRAVMTGDEFRFIRVELNMSQVHLAQLIGVVESSLRNWERGRTKEVAEPSARLLKYLYKESLDKHSNLGDMLAKISQLNREKHHQKLQLEETKDGWKLAA